MKNFIYVIAALVMASFACTNNNRTESASAGKDTVAAAPTSNPQPPTFTVGVTDVTFNSVNAIFGRLLRTKDGHVVTRDYWLQKEAVSLDDVPYYE